MISTYAVLTGDLVGSTAMSANEFSKSIQALDRGSKRAEEWLGQPAHFTRCRGDGWQMLVTDARLALRVSLLLKAGLRSEGQGLSTRVAIATGTAPFERQSNLNFVGGDVFQASGRALDSMQRSMTLHHCAEGGFGAVARLFDYISSGWPARQAAAVSLAIDPQRTTFRDMATSLGISRQATGQSLVSAGFDAISDALLLIEQVEV